MYGLASTATLLGCIVLDVYGLPSVEKRDGSLPADFGNHPYMRPLVHDQRSPCPGLNTLANHGYLPRNGQMITRNDLSRAFSDGWGIAQDVIATPTENAFIVCAFNNGGDCGDYFDLHDLNTPDTFEHDHSMSREDFRALYTDSDVDNFTFNRTVMGDSLSVLQGRPVMNVNDAEEIRLVREHLAYIRDPVGWFKDNRQTMGTEFGFIFAVMRNFAAKRGNTDVQSPNQLSDQTVQADWWSYWFSREQFPTEIGWRKPVPDVANAYVLGIRTSIFAATASSTPSPLPPDATKSPTARPVVGGKREVEAGPTFGLNDLIPSGVLSIPTHILEQAKKVAMTAAPSPPSLQMYDQVYVVEDVVQYKSSLSTFESSFSSAMTSLLNLDSALPTNLPISLPISLPITGLPIPRAAEPTP